VTGDKIDWAPAEADIFKQFVDGCPPLLSGTDEANVRAAQHAQSEVLALLANCKEISPEAITPDNLKTAPVLGSDVQALAYNLGDLGVDRRRTFHAALKELHGGGVGVEEPVKLVPLDLERDQGRDDVICVADTGDEGGQSVFAIEEPLAAAGGGRDSLPLLDLEAILGEDFF